MSNYPPGVTGNERQIRGWDERTTTKVCGLSASLRIFPHDELVALESLIRSAVQLRDDEKEWGVRHRENRKKLHTRDNLDNRHKFVTSQLASFDNFWRHYNEAQITIDMDCPFEGDVDTQYGDGIEFWTCPICGAEHEEEIE